MKVLILGLGSIARKHIAALQKLQPEVELWALRSSKMSNQVENVKNVYSIETLDLQAFDFFLISSPTHAHFEQLQPLLPSGKPIFLEKPPLHQLQNVNQLLQGQNESQSLIYTGYNMRFHPAVQWLKVLAENHRIIEVNAYCGSYLPDWRPDLDYRENYSAHESRGGGVHLDVIHELDYLTWIFGKPINSSTHLAKISDLKISSVDSANYWLKYPQTVVNISLNYFRRIPKRNIEVVTDNDLYVLDLLKSTVKKDGEDFDAFSTGIAETYTHQMMYFIDVINGKKELMTSFEDALDLLKIALDE